MNSKAVIGAIAAASLGFVSLSFAQGYEPRGPLGRDGHPSEHRGINPRNGYVGQNSAPEVLIIGTRAEIRTLVLAKRSRPNACAS